MLFTVVNSGRMYGQLVQNVMHFNKGDGVWPTDAVTLSTAIRDKWLGGTTGIRLQESTDVLWNEVRVYKTGDSMLTPVTLTVSIQGTDSNGATQIMSFTSYILRIRAETGGRHGRGRVYIPAARFGHFINGQLSAAAISAWAPILIGLNADWVGSSPGSGFNIVIAKGTNQVDFFTANALTLSPTAGVQRRRNIGVGA